MKQKQIHLIAFPFSPSPKELIKKEWVRFAKDQFAALAKKNLKIPVSIYNL